MGVGSSKKKVEPQFGVSFGLPYPSFGYPLNTFNGAYPAQNPYFGSISPNGLNLGILNINPLVSFQFTKNEYGEKTFKPLVNFHVTPNERLIQKVGNFLKTKNHGNTYGVQPASNQHYHTHAHYAIPHPTYQDSQYIYPFPNEYGLNGQGNAADMEFFHRYMDRPSDYSDEEYSFGTNAYTAYPFDPNFLRRNSNSSISIYSEQKKNIQNGNSNSQVEEIDSNHNAYKYASRYQLYDQNISQNLNRPQTGNQYMQSILFPTNRRRRRTTNKFNFEDGFDTFIDQSKRKVRFFQSNFAACCKINVAELKQMIASNA